MTDRLALRRELLDIIETHKEGFGRTVRGGATTANHAAMQR